MTQLRLLNIAGSLLFLGYVAFFLLLQSQFFWHAPTFVPDRWQEIFYPIKNLFPIAWIQASRGSALGYLNIGVYLIILAELFIVYLYAVHRAFRSADFTEGHGKAALRTILFVTVLILGILLIVPGMFSSDVLSYLWYGLILGAYSDNPYIKVPIDYLWSDHRHWLESVNWKELPSPYGPVWLWLVAGIAKLAQASGGDLVHHILGHKLLAGIAHLVNIVLIWNVARIVIARYWHVPGLAPSVTVNDWRTGAQIAVTLTYAWNPLLLIEFGANGHNDVLMLTGLIAAIWLHLSGQWRLATLALALASLVKASALLFLPAYLWLLFWQTAQYRMSPGLVSRVWTGAQALGIVAMAWIVGYAPFWEGPSTLRALSFNIVAKPLSYATSLGAVVQFTLAQGIGHIADALEWQPAQFWASEVLFSRLEEPVRWSLIIITATIASIQTWYARTFPGMLKAWGWALFAYLTVGLAVFLPWYVSWLVVPVVLLGPGRLLTAGLILCASSMTYYLPSPWTRAITVLAPPLIYVLSSVMLDAMHRRSVRSGAQLLAHTD